MEEKIKAFAIEIMQAMPAVMIKAEFLRLIEKNLILAWAGGREEQLTIDAKVLG